jgi:hypothetical protein
MTSEPYASAQRVFWIVDNDSSHRGQRSIDRLQGAWPSLVLVHLPVHASWLNQIEIYFSILQRKALTPPPLRQPCRTREPDHELPARLAARRHPDRLALHPPRPQPTTRAHQPPRPTPQCGLTVLPGTSTSNTRSHPFRQPTTCREEPGHTPNRVSGTHRMRQRS